MPAPFSGENLPLPVIWIEPSAMTDIVTGGFPPVPWISTFVSA
jgi:hypothetical protein